MRQGNMIVGRRESRLRIERYRIEENNELVISVIIGGLVLDIAGKNVGSLKSNVLLLLLLLLCICYTFILTLPYASCCGSFVSNFSSHVTEYATDIRNPRLNEKTPGTNR